MQAAIEPSMPDFDEVALALQNIAAEPNASEAHGMICGFICAGSKMDGQSWLEHIVGHPDKANDNASQYLLDLYELSSVQLRSAMFDFALLLPDDDDELMTRAACLGDWCYGFLVGLELSGIDLEADDYEELEEILQHFAEIANIDYDSVEISNEDEAAYIEVVEYTRLAVVAAYQEIAMPADDTPTGKGKLH